MPLLKDLIGIPLEDIHAAFVDAFSRYEVPMDLPPERLAEMMRTRSYDPALSVGAFDDDRLVAFALTGYREAGTERLGYDIATGVVQAAQNEGLGGLVVEELLARGRAAGLTRFLLEVLVNNEAAQKVYAKRGFAVTRRLVCYELSRDVLRPPASHAFEVDALTELPASLDERLYCSFAPTWQNALPSYAAVRDLYALRTLSDGQGLAGYGIVHRARGAILQIGLRPDLRDAEPLALVTALLGGATPADKLVMTNIEAESGLDRLAVASGWTRTVEQFEMAYEFGRGQSTAEPSDGHGV